MKQLKLGTGGLIMARLIDVDKLLTNAIIGSNSKGQVAWSIVPTIDILAAPIVDAVPVVRCKDCKYHHWKQEPCHGKTVHYCELPHMRGIEVFKEFFCYYGKQKESDEVNL